MIFNFLLSLLVLSLRFSFIYNILNMKKVEKVNLTEKEIMMIVPNNVTFGEYHLTAWQENILTLIGHKLQKYMTREQDIPRDLFNQPYVSVLCDEAAGKNHKAELKKEILDLCKKPFKFTWLHDAHQTRETGGVIITTYHDLKGTNEIQLVFNVWAIPFLIYYGVGVGGTRYSKVIALKLRGNYTKRIYKIICSQQDRNEYYYDLKKFRKDLGISDKYTNACIERQVLKPSAERIKASGSQVWFEYKMICKTPTPGRKPKSDTIVFRIKTAHPRETGGERFNEYNYVYNWIKRAMGYPTTDIALTAVEKITSSGRLKEVYERICYWDDQVVKGEKTTQHASNSLLKMLREDFNVTYKVKNENTASQKIRKNVKK